MILGIDLGTTHSAVGVVDSGFPILLADEDGKRIIPSAVWFGKDGGVEVGRKALRRRAADQGRVVTSVKRWMGADDISDPVLETVGKSPEEVSAEILKELKRIAEWRLETEVSKAVITVPAYFNDGQRAATKAAGELAGLEVVRIINEPTAAALAYGLDKLQDKARVAVYDLGGGTFDLTILEMEGGVFQVLATHGDTQLGGDDVDRMIFEKLTAGAGEIAAGVEWKFMEEAEKAKRALSDAEDYAVRIPFYDGSRSIEQTLTRAELDVMTKGWIARTLKCCRQALLDSGLEAADLDAVVLVGGSTRMPAVRSAVADFFQKEVDVTQHPDEAIALGATIQAGVMSGAMRKMVLLDVTPLSLGIETFGGLMNVIIPRNTTIPCKAGEMFTNAADGQESMAVRVLQGEREMARDNWELGKFEVEMEKLPKGQARVGVQFKIDADGILEVLARDTKTGKDTVVNIASSAVDVDDAAVEEMVGQSVEYAFEDMSERIFTEARMKAEELIPAVEMILAQGMVEEDERGEIEEALVGVKKAVSDGAANPLKAAVQRLDKATEAAAARLVERAMEAALEKELGI
ncbi:MAG: Hsp70 family protein [Akkermansiaceae bacterium]|nr:Hsp70 family protein [Akkermansiaceae bacterium]MDP4898469.1 Hsp70 family protein [Akkermansiaceae bacterium]